MTDVQSPFETVLREYVEATEWYLDCLAGVQTAGLEQAKIAHQVALDKARSLLGDE